MLDVDGDGMNDLAIGAGQERVVIHSRDRKLSQEKASRESVGAATVSRQSFSFGLRALAVGNFTGKWRDLAALGDDGKLHLLEIAKAHSQVQAALAIAG